VLNEFFNELAYNPGPSKGGFLFFLPWDNHNLNSVVSSGDAHGPLGRSLLYFNCEVLGILTGVAEINPTVNLLVGLVKPPTKAECLAEGIKPPGGVAAGVHGSAPRGGLFSGILSQPFGGGGGSSKPVAHTARKGG
jgi:hypothetical protein